MAKKSPSDQRQIPHETIDGGLPIISFDTRAVQGVCSDPFEESRFASFESGQDGTVRIWDLRWLKRDVLSIRSDQTSNSYEDVDGLSRGLGKVQSWKEIKWSKIRRGALATLHVEDGMKVWDLREGVETWDDDGIYEKVDRIGTRRGREVGKEEKSFESALGLRNRTQLKDGNPTIREEEEGEILGEEGVGLGNKKFNGQDSDWERIRGWNPLRTLFVTNSNGGKLYCCLNLSLDPSWLEI
jgi:WD40 repeat protein